MGEIINLRNARKAKARETKAAEAAINRAMHGRTVATRKAETGERERRDVLLDGAAIVRDEAE